MGPLDRVAQGTLIKEAGHMENLQWFIRAHAENSRRMRKESEDASHGSGNRADAKNF